MKLHQDPEQAKATRKSLKPQVERRRRERMNRSMESLKTLLLHKQEETQRRVEKAEILEHTVLFLQSTARGERLPCGGGAQRRSFQDGASSCLQRAAQFLGPRGKGLWLGAALDASFAARFARSDPDPAEVLSPRSPRSSSGFLSKSTVSTLRLLVNRSRLCTPASNGTSCVQTRVEPHRSPSSPHQTHTATGRAGKRSPSRSLPVSQALWRPWP